MNIINDEETAPSAGEMVTLQHETEALQNISHQVKRYIRVYMAIFVPMWDFVFHAPGIFFLYCILYM